ncbi:hypothetical protein [Streptomyces sp. NPDC047141]|uniref:hypothetical protein n=1 Tax=Streptomyces sp. NPDC047141 TaxID=3155738 RepID=UPI003409DF50
MPLVLVQGAVLACPHQGRLTLLTGDPRITVEEHGVVLAGQENGLVFGSPVTPVPGMITPCTASTPDGPKPCVVAPATPDGSARRLTVGGLPVLLATAHGVTASGLGPGVWNVTDPGQSLLETL